MVNPLDIYILLENGLAQLSRYEYSRLDLGFGLYPDILYLLCSFMHSRTVHRLKSHRGNSGEVKEENSAQKILYHTCHLRLTSGY